MKKLQPNLAYLSIAVLLVASPLMAWMGVNVTWNAADPAEGGRSDTYREAQRALTNEDWEDAEVLFTQVADGGGSDADAALYWKAYVLLKRGRAGLARQTVQQLERDYPQSSWLDDARALEAEARQASGRIVNPGEEEDEELKLYALNSLMHMDSERALPVLEDFLKGDHSVELKEKALFVISQSGSSRAREILESVAKGQRHPELAMKAIELLGLEGGSETGQALQEIYSSATDPRVKSKALEGLMLGDHEQAVLAAARGESDPDLRGKAVEMLGLMDARAELQELYRTESDPEVKARILEGLFIAGDAATLSELARTEPDPALRRKAIEGLGLVDSQESNEALASLYESETDTETKKKILEAFFLMDDAETLGRMARTEQNPELRAKAIEGLGLVSTDGSRETLTALYSSETDRDIKESILQAFMLQENHQALIEVVRSEEDRELRKKALEYLSMIDSDEAMDFLLTALED
jgi:hypothetical protein